MRNKQILALALIVLALGGFSWVAVSSGQTTPGQDDSQITKSLLDEVRQLRLVLQRNSVATYRAQVALERLKLQQTQVNELLKEQTELRNRTKDVERYLSNLTGQSAELEKLVEISTTPAEHSDRERSLKRLNTEVESTKQQIQEWREREAQLAIRLQSEQAKLNELNESLDKLERELENAAGTEKGKRP